MYEVRWNNFFIGICEFTITLINNSEYTNIEFSVDHFTNENFIEYHKNWFNSYGSSGNLNIKDTKQNINYDYIGNIILNNISRYTSNYNTRFTYNFVFTGKENEYVAEVEETDKVKYNESYNDPDKKYDELLDKLLDKYLPYEVLNKLLKPKEEVKEESKKKEEFNYKRKVTF